jgi:hypothetical protein
MTSSERHKRLRAELAAELGYIPASLAPDEIERHRQLNAAADSAPSQERIVRKFAHLREEKRRSDVEVVGRAAIADLDEWSSPLTCCRWLCPVNSCQQLPPGGLRRN